jgi:succinate dehydrogenase / fumarate reductase cytochrome b subunit
MRIFSIVQDISRNRNEGTIAFILHRITGICLAGYIFLHLVVLGSDFILGKGSFGKLMGQFEQPLFKILEIALIGVITFHLINGLRIIVLDFLRFTRIQRVLFWVVVFLWVIVVGITAVVFLC